VVHENLGYYSKCILHRLWSSGSALPGSSSPPHLVTTERGAAHPAR
jgi:hypothetical protein